MRVAPILETRRKTVAHLKADMLVTAQISSGRIYGERTPETVGWPFVRMGEFEGEPGFAVIGNVHVFSKSAFTDEVNSLVETIGESLDSAVLTLDDGRRAHLVVERTRILPDPEEQSAWHGILSIRATISKDCTES